MSSEFTNSAGLVSPSSASRRYMNYDHKLSGWRLATGCWLLAGVNEDLAGGGTLRSVVDSKYRSLLQGAAGQIFQVPAYTKSDHLKKKYPLNKSGERVLLAESGQASQHECCVTVTYVMQDLSCKCATG